MGQLVSLFHNHDDAAAGICSIYGLNFGLSSISADGISLLIDPNIVNLLISSRDEEASEVFVIRHTDETQEISLDLKDHNSQTIEADGKRTTFKLMNILFKDGYVIGAELLISSPGEFE